MKLSKPLLHNVVFHICLSLLLSGLMYWQFGFHGRNMHVPIAFDGDTMHFLAAARTMIDSTDWHETDRLSAPFSFPVLAFQAGDGTLGKYLLRGVTWFIRSPGMAVNLLFVLELLLAGNVMAWCLRQLSMGREVSLAGGVLWALLPYHQAISTVHLMTIPWLAPAVMTWAVLLAEPDRLETLKRRKVLLAMVAAAGLASIYPAFFSGFCLALGTLTGWLAARDRRTLRFGLIALSLMLCVFVIGILPGILSWIEDPRTWAILESMKSPQEVDGSTALLRHLLVPPSTHPFAPFAWLGRQMQMAVLRLDAGESMRMGWPGTVSSLGLVLLFGILAGGVPRRIESHSRILRQAAALALGLFLLATAGGIGSIWNVLVTPQIRSYVRYVPFLCAVCLPIGLLPIALTSLPWMRRALAALLILLGSLDQSATREFPGFYLADAKKFLELTDMVGRLESQFQPGEMVFQLPWTPYPSTPHVHQLRADEHLAAYTVSRTLKWSWPAFTARSVDWQRYVSSLSGKPLCDRLVQAGFSALWIDRRAYSDRAAALAAGVEPLLGGPLMSSPNGHIVVYDLRPYREAQRAQHTPEEWDAIANAALHLYYSWGQPFRLDGAAGQESFVSVVRGVAGDEQNRFRWTNGRRASFAFDVARPAAGAVRLDITTVPNGLIVDNFRLDARVDGCSAGQRVLARGPESYSLTIPGKCIAGKSSFLLEFYMPDAVSPLELGLGGDVRRLGMAVHSINLSASEAPAAGTGERQTP